MSMFTKATKAQAKARVAFAGPTGSGKTWTSLVWAHVLGQRVALIDTERGSASLYAPHFDFDTLTMSPPYEPSRLVEALKAAEAEQYDVVVIDSLSHFWEGEGGTLDIADAAGQRSGGNSFAGWKVATPELRHLVDSLLGIDCHVIVTMRSKMEYVLEEDSRGKKVPKKVGMAPVMRAGVEYEFTMVGDLDLEHRLTFTKSRCDVLADTMVQPGRAGEAAETFRNWLDDGEPVATRNDIDGVRSRIAGLDEQGKLQLRELWDARGLPATARLLASQVELAHELVALCENKIPTPPAGGIETTPNQGDGRDGAVTEGTTGQAAAARPEEEPAQTTPAGDTPEPDPAPPAAPPTSEDPAAAAAPPTDGPPSFLERLRALPADLAAVVREGEAAILARGVEPKSPQHKDETLALLADVEKAQTKRAQQVVLTINAGTNTVWHRAATDEERHQLLLAFTDGDVSSAKRVTATQLKDIKKRVREWQTGTVTIEQAAGGEYTMRAAEAVAS